ncbi:hypothetical protein CTI12_AA552860 [Artemisia annua]|uniref:Uncharacterized protein n=1 Tax=Artemisia annua TaxID=35608 RepID=A0A2U1KXG1_ARTAN|nr:hypothetical protein CTI12_AA552860 [Artemisia annua]
MVAYLLIQRVTQSSYKFQHQTAIYAEGRLGNTKNEPKEAQGKLKQTLIEFYEKLRYLKNYRCRPKKILRQTPPIWLLATYLDTRTQEVTT